MAAMMIQNTVVGDDGGSPPPGSPTFMPQMLAISVAGRNTMCEIAESRERNGGRP
jgi:hypothetical protein